MCILPYKHALVLVHRIPTGIDIKVSIWGHQPTYNTIMFSSEPVQYCYFSVDTKK